MQEDPYPLNINRLIPRDGNFFDATLGYEEDEDDKAFRFSLDLPGVKANDLEVMIKENVLSISGARRVRSSKVSNSKKARFQRSLVLNTDNVDVTKMTANLTDGVLSVVVPKKPRTEPLRIPVTTDAPQEASQKQDEKEGDAKVCKETKHPPA